MDNEILKMDISQLENKTREELIDVAKEMGISNYTGLKKQDLIIRLLHAYTDQVPGPLWTLPMK